MIMRRTRVLISLDGTVQAPGPEHDIDTDLKAIKQRSSTWQLLLNIRVS